MWAWFVRIVQQLISYATRVYFGSMVWCGEGIQAVYDVVKDGNQQQLVFVGRLRHTCGIMDGLILKVLEQNLKKPIHVAMYRTSLLSTYRLPLVSWFVERVLNFSHVLYGTNDNDLENALKRGEHVAVLLPPVDATMEPDDVCDMHLFYEVDRLCRMLSAEQPGMPRQLHIVPFDVCYEYGKPESCRFRSHMSIELGAVIHVSLQKPQEQHAQSAEQHTQLDEQHTQSQEQHTQSQEQHAQLEDPSGVELQEPRDKVMEDEDDQLVDVSDSPATTEQQQHQQDDEEDDEDDEDDDDDDSVGPDQAAFKDAVWCVAATVFACLQSIDSANMIARHKCSASYLHTARYASALLTRFQSHLQQETLSSTSMLMAMFCSARRSVSAATAAKQTNDKHGNSVTMHTVTTNHCIRKMKYALELYMRGQKQLTLFRIPADDAVYRMLVAAGTVLTWLSSCVIHVTSWMLHVLACCFVSTNIKIINMANMMPGKPYARLAANANPTHMRRKNSAVLHVLVGTALALCVLTSQLVLVGWAMWYGGVWMGIVVLIDCVFINLLHEMASIYDWRLAKMAGYNTRASSTQLRALATGLYANTLHYRETVELMQTVANTNKMAENVAADSSNEEDEHVDVAGER